MFKGVDNPIKAYPEQTARTVSTLVKTADEQKSAGRVLERWREENGNK